MKSIKTLLILTAMLAGAATVHASSHAAGAAKPLDAAKKETAMANPADMAEGEIRKIDRDAKKITLKHGEIKSLDMPPMTMVFQVRDAALLDKIKTGDKVRFKAENAGGAMVVTEIQPAK